MNPVTRRLLEQIDNPHLAEFALAWDGFEECIVRVYRLGACQAEDEIQYGQLRDRLERDIGTWEHALEPHWRATRIDAAAPPESPFRMVLAVRQVQAVIGNWELMRTLPAAREALNHLLLENRVD